MTMVKAAVAASAVTMVRAALFVFEIMISPRVDVEPMSRTVIMEMRGTTRVCATLVEGEHFSFRYGPPVYDNENFFF
ncbi:hypothetical protein ABT001_23505 [Streptomyces sp. NPDC002793]|uniref:hypothetical protein n=1 Tax=Streptomyces sp. NPDC002793 TaxID=3154432 RepID=UPI00332EA2C4